MLLDWRGVLALGVVGAAGVGYLMHRGGRAKAAAAAALARVNPTDPTNVIYGAVNATGQAITMDRHWSLGTGLLWDIFGGEARDRERASLQGLVP